MKTKVDNVRILGTTLRIMLPSFYGKIGLDMLIHASYSIPMSEVEWVGFSMIDVTFERNNIVDIKKVGETIRDEMIAHIKAHLKGKSEEELYIASISWKTQKQEVEIRATSLEEAKKKLQQEHQPREQSYVKESFQIDKIKQEGG